jgi:pantetheine-phosphate adenylyltransferase
MTIAVYAGSFDPPTLGHLEVARRAARLFTHVRILVADNPSKEPWFSAEARVELWREAAALMPNVSVAKTPGLVVDHARDIGASVLVRGLRGASDADSEAWLARANEELAPGLATFLVPCPESLAGVSSSELKRRALEGLDIDAWCPKGVAEQLQRTARQRRALQRGEGVHP